MGAFCGVLKYCYIFLQLDDTENRNFSHRKTVLFVMTPYDVNGNICFSVGFAVKQVNEWFDANNTGLRAEIHYRTITRRVSQEVS